MALECCKRLSREERCECGYEVSPRDTVQHLPNMSGFPVDHTVRWIELKKKEFAATAMLTVAQGMDFVMVGIIFRANRDG
ncbi:MAG: hypothetical protein ACLTDC_08460 [Lachnospiraceae bacterium]